MNAMRALPALSVLAACAAHSPSPYAEATRDLVAVAELPEVDSVRLRERFSFRYLNDSFILVSQLNGNYLVEFQSPCRALRRSSVSATMVDVRRDANHLHAKWDTIRGCRIDKIYALSRSEVKELFGLHSA